jgi:hypothetical protein
LPVEIPNNLGNKKAEVLILCFSSTLVVYFCSAQRAHHHAGGLNQ